MKCDICGCPDDGYHYINCTQDEIRKEPLVREENELYFDEDLQQFLSITRKNVSKILRRKLKNANLQLEEAIDALAFLYNKAYENNKTLSINVLRKILYGISHDLDNEIVRKFNSKYRTK